MSIKNIYAQNNVHDKCPTPNKRVMLFQLYG